MPLTALTDLLFMSLIKCEDVITTLDTYFTFFLRVSQQMNSVLEAGYTYSESSPTLSVKKKKLNDML